jgi:hypothetical protein
LQLALDSQQHGDAATAVEHYGRCLQIARELALPSYETVFVILTSASADLHPQRYAAGQVIVRQGDEADAFYIVTDGQLDVLLDQPDNPPLAVNRLRRGEYFGEIALLRGGRRTATVRVSTDAPAEALALDRATFDRLLAESETARNDVERVLSVRGVGPLPRSGPPASGSADVDFPYASTSKSTRSPAS